MRMVVISLIVLLIFIGLWVWFYYTSIEPVTSFFWEDLARVSDLIAVDEWKKVSSNMYSYHEVWEKTKNLWMFFINQNDIDNIDASMRKLDSFIRNHDKNMAQAELEQLRVLFNVINENECLSWDNIF